MKKHNNRNMENENVSTTADPTSVSFEAGNKRRRRYVVSTIALFIVSVLGIASVTIPVPYVVATPGPTLDLNAPYEGKELLTVSGTDPNTHQPITPDEQHDGQLRMVTVSEYGGPGFRIAAFDLLRLSLDPDSKVEYYYDLYPEDITADQAQSFSQALMTSSHSTSSVVALETLGYTVPAVITVNGLADTSDAKGKVKEGDILVSITDPKGTVHPINRAGTIFEVMAKTPVDSQVNLTVQRDGKELPLTVKSGSSPDNVGSKLGIFLDIQTELPLDVTFSVEDIGGPSAGMMFALAIIDKATEGDLTGGHKVAGTGALHYDGRVEPIGGLPQKLAGAHRDGATHFLAPDFNCDEITQVPEGLEVYRVATIKEALSALDAIAHDDTSALRPCVIKK